ncbi:MAG: transglycosylase SLT domain-containing protein [Mariniphaga sp.]|nr:transglycosylase SLT domain-containing protein [Mariniphaga sp.]MDD4426338.1 transglycosylase SLT domain-containing protein [Mariniphaga sp.]
MRKKFYLLFATILVSFNGHFLFAQEIEEPMNEIAGIRSKETGLVAPDSIAQLPIDTLLADTLFFDGFSLPDEDLNDIFLEKMDSLENTWYIKKLFHDYASDSGLTDYFPVELTDSVYIARLIEIQQVVDLSYNNVVKNFIKLYTEKRRDLAEIILGLSAYYFPIFEETLDRYNLPLELKYLPVIESALNPQALSRAGANGLWQFMYGTGRQLGLEVSSFVDERRDPYKSTDAAARYLQQLYSTYGDWHLAIAAYNCGPGNLNRAIQRSGNKRNYWEIYYRLPRETRGYVPAYIAAAYLMNYYREHNLRPRMPEIPLQNDTVIVHDYLHFNQLENILGVKKEQLRSLNPMYRRDVIPAKPAKPYPLVLSNDLIRNFIAQDSLVFAYDREKYFPDNTLVNPVNHSSNFTPIDIEGKAKVLYTVKSGDNIGFISSWFHVRSSDLRYWNNIHRNLIRVGQKLVIYVPEEQKDKYEKVNSMSFAQKQAFIGKPVSNSAKETKPLDPHFEYYTVRSGDTVWEIAQRFPEISAEEILRLNNLRNNTKLSIGQKLKIKPRS